MFDDMPDDWREAIDKITEDWTESLDDLIEKHTEAEFLKHAAAAGANFDLVQTEALKKLIAEDVGFIAATNKEIAKSIIDDVEQLLIVKGDWASAKEAVFEHINKVFSGQEKIVIDNIGKSAKRVVLDKELGHAVIRDFVVKRKWVGNIEAYSDMVARSLSQKARSMGDFEGYRTTYGIIGWRRMSSLGGKTCEICASLHGREYIFAGERASILPDDDGFMFEPHPNGYCYQTPIYADWVGIKNLSDMQLDDHLERWKIDNSIDIPNLKRVPKDYGRTTADRATQCIVMRELADTDYKREKFLEEHGWNFDESKYWGRGKLTRHDRVHIEDGRIYAISDIAVIDDNLIISFLEVNPDMMRQGYGTKAMSDIVRIALDNKNKRIQLSSASKNSDKFYDALGMTRLSAEVGEYTGDEIWMRKFLELI